MPRICSAVTCLAALAIASALIAHTAAAQQTAPLPTFLKLGQNTEVNDFIVSPDGRFVMRSMKTGIEIVVVATGRVIALAGGDAGDAAWSPRGDRIVWTRWDGEPKQPTVWTIAIDPSTGMAASKPQRVSLGIGQSAAVSFDGKLVAYSTAADTGSGGFRNSARRVVVVPMLGGPERTIARTARSIDALYWSPDGRTLFAAGGSPDTTTVALTRISVADGTVRVLSRLGAFTAGVSTDRRTFALIPYGWSARPGAVVTLVDSGGRTVGTVPLRVGQRIYYGGLLKDSAVVLMDFQDHWGLEFRNVAGGGARSIPIVGTANFAPKWSPDGRRVAFSVERNGTRHLAVVNADGTALREFAEAIVRPDEWGAQWSGDGRAIAYQSPDQRNLYMLDVATGRSRALLTNVRAGKFRWSIDGTEIVIVVTDTGMYRIALDGRKRLIMPFSKVPGVRYLEVAPSAVVTRRDSTLLVSPLGGGATRTISGLPPRAQGTSATSRDGRYLAAFIGDSLNDKLEIFATDTWQHRVVDLPFKLRPLAFDPAFANDNKSLVVMGYRSTDSIQQVFSVPLDGARPTVLGSLNANQPGASLSVSPDGKQVVHTSRRSYARNLVLLDLRPALRAGARSGNGKQ